MEHINTPSPLKLEVIRDEKNLFQFGNTTQEERKQTQQASGWGYPSQACSLCTPTPQLQA